MSHWRCWLGHAMVTRDDNTHLWGECIHCGKRAGLISRKAVRAYIEAEERSKILAAKPARRREPP